MNQVAYVQDPARSEVDRGVIWHDVVQAPRATLTGVQAVGVVVYSRKEGALTNDGTNRDWDGKRLLIPVTGLSN